MIIRLFYRINNRLHYIFMLETGALQLFQLSILFEKLHNELDNEVFLLPDGNSFVIKQMGQIGMTWTRKQNVWETRFGRLRSRIRESMDPATDVDYEFCLVQSWEDIYGTTNKLLVQQPLLYHPNLWELTLRVD